MGTIKQGILGGFSGKVGTVVGSTWKSVHYMRALAVSFSDPRTEKQKNQRSKFTAAVNFTKAMDTKNFPDSNQHSMLPYRIF